MGKVVLKMVNIDKHFPGVQALKQANLEVREGEVHALLGGNGAGKSTMIKILGAIYQPDGGEIYIDGQLARLESVRDAQRYGISIIHQELMLFPEMSIAENIFLGERADRYGYINRREIEARAQKLLDDLNIDFDSRWLVSSLSVAQQQLIEIIKAVSFNARIIVMDEPTSSLSKGEVSMLFEIIRKLQKKGVSIIYISHKLDELFEISERITVLRDGETVGTVNTKETTEDDLIRMMVGRELSSFYTRTEAKGSNEVVLAVRGLEKEGVFHDINFELRKGEILGFTGLVGAGRTELMEAIFGIRSFDRGEILLNGTKLDIKAPKNAIEAGIVLVPENRKEHGLVLKNTVGFNMTITILERFMKWLKVDRKEEQAIMDHYKETLRIKTPSYSQIASKLSGGNQQKVVLAKSLAREPVVLILDEPTRGIDVGAKAEIYALMNELVQQGVSIIMVSSELQEVMVMSDRICVMTEGTISATLDKDDFSQEKIVAYSVRRN
ncbi:MAG: sugar ABC transporter ATP-binding protein [Firmicutes bacterium]|nr:sugar ABC transporter ATP-binding protein [Bacillota bacterium]